jgi:hypothetical protein
LKLRHLLPKIELRTVRAVITDGRGLKRVMSPQDLAQRKVRPSVMTGIPEQAVTVHCRIGRSEMRGIRASAAFT